MEICFNRPLYAVQKNNTIHLNFKFTYIQKQNIPNNVWYTTYEWDEMRVLFCGFTIELEG